MQPYLDGKMLLINKPLKWTSFDAVKKVRTLTGVSKVGHAGTLDPLATGLLIICTGSFTKKITTYMGMEKEYTGSITIGSTTPTYDLESIPENHREIAHITPEQILATTKQFIGTIQQIPPMHSAIKKEGTPLYLLARKGIETTIEPRTITISTFDITAIEHDIIYFKVICTTGTYIRSLAFDFGNALGTGAHLSSLCRTRIGDFSVDEASTTIEFEKNIESLKSSFK